MSDIKLFRLQGEVARELAGSGVELERSLQILMERNLEILLSITFLASEHPTGKNHAGRIDTLGLDENKCPVILEYKRTLSENVINQGLFYLDWLMDHKAEFKLLAIERLGAKEADTIDWSQPRVLCVAADFTRYDEHAVRQMGRNIELIRYRRFGDDLLLLDLVVAGGGSAPANSAKATAKTEAAGTPRDSARGGRAQRTISDAREDLEEPLALLFENLRLWVLSFGDDVQEKTLKHYIVYRRMRVFVSIHKQKKCLKVFVKVDPDSVKLEEGFTRDCRGLGHLGVGDLEISIADAGDFERAKPLIMRSYESN